MGNFILAHCGGLLTACKVLKTDGDRVRVQVSDEKRPKWVDLSTGKQKLFQSADAALEWIEEVGRG